MRKECTGFITAVKNAGESGRSLELLTPEGVTYLFAPGARRLNSKLLPVTRLYLLIQAEYEETPGFQRLSEAVVLADFSEFTKDAELFDLAAEAVRVVKIMLANTQSPEPFYALTLLFAEQMNKLFQSSAPQEQFQMLELKFYLYLLALCDFDVPLLCRQKGSGSALSKLCSSLSGLSISQGIRVQSPTIPTGAARAQLQDIYREQLDIVI